MKKLLFTIKLLALIFTVFLFFISNFISNFLINRIVLRYIIITILLILLVFLFFTFYTKNFFLIKTLNKSANKLLYSYNKKNIFSFIAIDIISIISTEAFLISIFLALPLIINIQNFKENLILEIFKNIFLITLILIAVILSYIKFKIILKLKKNTYLKYNSTFKIYSQYLNDVCIKTYKINKIIYFHNIIFILFILFSSLYNV